MEALCLWFDVEATCGRPPRAPTPGGRLRDACVPLHFKSFAVKLPHPSEHRCRSTAWPTCTWRTRTPRRLRCRPAGCWGWTPAAARLPRCVRVWGAAAAGDGAAAGSLHAGRVSGWVPTALRLPKYAHLGTFVFFGGGASGGWRPAGAGRRRPRVCRGMHVGMHAWS